MRSDPCATPGTTMHLTTASPGPGLPTLTVTGSVITGHAGATSQLTDVDCHGGGLLETKVIAGYERTSLLPDTDQWATADIAWWPGRRPRQGCLARTVTVGAQAGASVSPIGREVELCDHL